MKVTVERSELLKSLGHVHRVVERRNTIPILANVLIRAEGATLGLKATDLDLEVIETIAAEASPGGSTTVPAHMFHDIVRKLPEGAGWGPSPARFRACWHRIGWKTLLWTGYRPCRIRGVAPPSWPPEASTFPLAEQGRR